MKYKYSKLYWFLRSFEWMKVYFSPFKPIIPKLYLGKVAIGCPWFLPRRWVKATPERAHKATEDYIKREESYNKLNPSYARTIKPYNEIIEYWVNAENSTTIAHWKDETSTASRRFPKQNHRELSNFARRYGCSPVDEVILPQLVQANHSLA